MGGKRSFFHELWRRKVLRVVAAYMAGVWFLLKMGEVIVSTLGLPDWSYRALVLVVIFGCPLSALFAWLFEITPEGIKLQSEVDRHGLPTRTGRVLTYFILVSVILAGAISIRTYISTDHARPSTKPVPGTAKTTSIAVLPFSNMSADAENEYFADGLSEELLNLLAKIQELKVVGRTSSFSFKGKHDDLREIGQKLNVATVLEGSVRKSGQSVRITAQLVNAEDGFHLWSETYDRTMGDIFVLQDEIASKVVEALKVTLLGHELESRDVSAETDPAAYDEYLRGMYHHRQRGSSDLEAAVQSYERALAIDPLFASAHAGLALTHTARAVMSYVPAEEGYALAELEVRRAIALRPDLAQPQYILGTIRMIRDWDWQGAEESFGRALELDPSNLSAVRGASDIAMIMGRREESVALAKRVAAADPLASTANFNLGIRQYQAGHFDDAKMTLERTLDLHPGSYMVPAAMAKVLVEKGEPQRALDVILSEPSELWRLAVLPIVYHALGREDDAERVLSELIEGYSEVAAFQIAEAYAVLGGEDEAFRWLEIAYEQRDPAMIDLISFPTLASLRQDPRFDSLRERMGLPEPSE